MSEPCKHGHVDGVMHKPCYECRCESLEAEIAALKRRLEIAHTALQTADQFITNGIELKFIRMPDADCPDRAHQTPGIIRAALKALAAEPPAGQEKR